jgi:hypothetical protein
MNDPCNKPCCPPATEKSYLMVEATASSANACGDPTPTSPELANCAKQEPTYDIIFSSFIVPEPGQNITVQVCNNTIYAINQFIEFLGYDGLKMRIVSIQSDKTTMILQNGCANGAFVVNNPTGGLAVSVNAQFIVVDSPSCTSTDESNEILQQGLSEATALCTPNLEEPVNDTVVYHIVGRTESDPSDTSLQKCIKRVKNLFFSLGAPRCPTITELVESDNFNYREVRADKATGQFKVRKMIGEHAGTLAGSKYIMAGTQSAEKAIGPAFVYSPFATPPTFGTVGTLTNEATYQAIAGGVTDSDDLTLPAVEIATLLNKNLQDHYYVNVHLTVMVDATSHASTRFLEVKLNDQTVMIITGKNGSAFTNGGSIVVPIKVLTAATIMNIKLVATGNNMTYAYKAVALGAFI